MKHLIMRIRYFLLRLCIGKWSVVANTKVIGSIEIHSPNFLYHSVFMGPESYNETEPMRPLVTEVND